MKRVPAHRCFLFCLLAVAGLSWDLYSKDVVFADLGFPGGVAKPFAQGRHVIFSAPDHVEGRSETYLNGWITFELYTSFNHGALWGVGKEFTWLFASLSIVAAAGVVYWLFVRGAACSLWLTMSLALIMAGTLGNLYDRMAWHECLNPDGTKIHAVRDFLLFTFGGWPWPIFNFADICLVTGALMLVVQSFRIETHGDQSSASEQQKQRKSAKPAEAPVQE